MSLYEYTKWDGSQQFQPQSAEKAFDQISEYLLQYGDQVLRNLDEFDDDDLPDILEKIQKQGLIEQVVHPKNARILQATVTAKGLEAPAAVELPEGGKQTLTVTLAPPAGSSVGNRSGNIVLTSGTHTVHIRWWGYVERPHLAKVHARHLPAARWIKGDTREGTKLVKLYRWPAGPACGTW